MENNVNLQSSSLQSPPKRSLLGDYRQFLRSPLLTIPPDTASHRQTSGQILRLYSLHLLLVLMVGVAIGQMTGPQDNLFQTLFAEFPVWFILVMAVVAAPIIEESIFRLPMQGSVFNLVLAGSLVMMIGLFWLVRDRAALIGCSAALVGLNLYLGFARPRVAALQRFYKRYPRLIFYGLTLLFGVLHITNYRSQVWALLPLLVMPQLLIGLWLGFIRLRYGFGWAILAHGFHNGWLLLPICLIQVLGSDQLTTGLGAPEITDFAPMDLLLILGIGLYFLCGLVLCCIAAWKLVRE